MRKTRTTQPAWQIQTAKARFSEVFRLARTEGPQRITRQGKEGVVMISEEQYHRLTVKSRQPKSLVRFFRESPLVGVKLWSGTKTRDATLRCERLSARRQPH